MSAFPGVAFITGAGSSLGAVIASYLIKGGCTRLALVDSNSESTAAKLQAAPSGKDISVEQIPYDHESDSSIDEAITQAITRFGAIHYCINLPIRQPGLGASLDITTEQWNEVLHLNQRQFWLLIRGELRQLLSQQKDKSDDGISCSTSIVNITSSHGLGAQPGFPVSAASSHAIVGMTRTVAMDYASSKVRVNAVCAGPIATVQLPGDEGARDQETAKRLLGVIPMGRFIEASEVASAAMWLLGDGAAAVTGLAVPVDGGWSLCHH